ncbi:MAG TPA: FtsQ-type POTRA domain-containing protein, partial [Deinococcales bacterium]|nr:FtsQ-type POTRA domain-containing protein [Deinococcales bacterium]
QTVYEQQGFPFRPEVTLDPYAVEGEDGAEEVTVNYVVEENPDVDSVTVEGAEALSAETVEQLFRPLTSTGEFDSELYMNAVAAVEEAYREEGLRLSGVDLERSRLEGGRLTVTVSERRITAIDTSEVGIDPDELGLTVGDLFNYDVLLADVRRIAEGRSSDVRLETRPAGENGVTVRLVEGPPETAGVIRDIEISGNTVISDEEIMEVLGLQPGDTFTSTLAEEDFEKIVALYEEDGWLVLDTPDFNWLDGVYVQRISEVKTGGHEVTFEGDRKNTKDFVITRYLPDEGEVLNQNELRRSLMQLQQLGVVEPRNIVLLAGDEPDEAVINAIVAETGTGVFTPSAQYSTDTGFSVSLSYSQQNLWGRAHSVGVELSGQTSSVGLLMSGSVRYSIPWLYVDFLDFKEVPTSLSLTLFSQATPNQPMSDGSSLTAPHPDTGQDVRVGQVT